MDSPSSNNYARAEQVHVRRASAVRIIGVNKRPHSTIVLQDSPSHHRFSPVQGHKQNQSLDFFPTTSLHSRSDEATSPISVDILVKSNRSQSRKSSTSTSVASHDSLESQLKLKRDAVQDSLALREQAIAQKLARTHRSFSRPKSTEQDASIDSRKDSMQDGQRQKPEEHAVAPQSPRGPQKQRPTVSAFQDGPHEAKVTFGSLSSRPLSFAAQKSPSSKWTPSSSSSETSSRHHDTHQQPASPTTYLDVSTLRYDASDSFDDTSSVDIKVMDDFSYSSAAASVQHLSIEDELEDERITPTEQQPEEQPEEQPVTDTPAHTSLESYQTPRSSDVKTENTTSDALAQASDHRQSSLIYWSPVKGAQTLMDDRSPEPIEEENWPLIMTQPEVKAPMSTVPTTDSATLCEEGTRKFSHASKLSQSSTSTILSPTFSNNRGTSTAGSTPFASPVDRKGHMSALFSAEIQDDNVSIAPSDFNAHVSQSSKQRLGLGGIVRKADVLPWEAVKPVPRPPKPVEKPHKRSQSNRFSALMKWRRAALDDIYQQERELIYAERQDLQSH